MMVVDVDPQTRKSRLWPKLLGFVLIGAAGSGCDLQSKAWAERTLMDAPGRSVAVIEPWLDLSLAYNRGTAFSAIPDLGDARWVFAVFAVAVIVALAAMVARLRPPWPEVVAMGAIAGGALGNAADRVFRLLPDGGTGVVDFVKINYPWGGSWPTFNVADILVVVGAIALVVLTYLRGVEDPATTALDESPA